LLSLPGTKPRLNDNEDDEHEHEHEHGQGDTEACRSSPPPSYPSPASASTSLNQSLASPRPAPPPFSSLDLNLHLRHSQDASAGQPSGDSYRLLSGAVPPIANDAEASSATAAPAYAPLASGSSDDDPTCSSLDYQDAVTETKRALPRDTKAESSGPKDKGDVPSEPPPAYTEGYSPLLSFTYLMAAAGGASSIITQVQQGGPPVNSIGGTWILPARCPLLYFVAK
jgi:G patch domain-containing protein 1